MGKINPELLKKLADPKWYLENLTKIKTKERGLVPFILKEAQKDLFNTVRNNARVIILKCRQIGFCLHPETKVLKSNLSWVKIDELKVGDRVIAVDETVLGGRGSSRKMRTAIVQDKWELKEEALRLTMDDGRDLVLTPEHRMLCKVRGAVHTEWRKAMDIRLNDEIRSITKLWEHNPSYEDGWISGILDGEGSVGIKRTGVDTAISQIDGFVWDRILKYFGDNNYLYRIEIDKRVSGSSSKFGSKPVNKLVISRMDEIFRLLGTVRPSRFCNKFWWEGKKFPHNGWSKVVKIELLPKQRMIDLQTSTKTFIANGFVSHNSTAMVGFFYHDTITNPGTTTAIIGYNSDLTSELLDKVKTFYKTTPAQLRPTIHYNTKYEISFPRMDSKILVLPSTENVGRGYTLNNVLATELSSWEQAEEKMMTLEASVPINGRIVVESSPKGTGNKYHRMWMTDNDYAKKMYGWWWGYSFEEIEIIRRRMNNPQKFSQEFCCEFLTSGRPVFASDIILNQRKNVLEVGDTFKDADGKSHTVKIENDLIIYKEPEKEDFFVCGVDISEGVTGGDYSVATIFNRRTGEQVAFFRGFIPPDRLAEKLNVWGRKFNNALMVVEVNNHGLTTLTVLRQKIYPSMYFRPARFEGIGMTTTNKLGWRTTKATRPLLIDELAQACRDGDLIIHSKEILDEMSVFVYNDNGDMVSQSGFWDDCIFSAGIAFQGFKSMAPTRPRQLNYEEYLPKSFSY